MLALNQGHGMSPIDRWRSFRKQRKENRGKPDEEGKKSSDHGEFKPKIFAVKAIVQQLIGRNDQTDADKKWEKKWRRLEVWGLYTAAAVGVAAIYWSGHDSERQLEIGNAPAVSFSGATIETFGHRISPTNLMWLLVPRLENSGPTPAQYVITNGSIIIDPQKESPYKIAQRWKPVDSSSTIKGSIAPHASMNLRIINIDSNDLNQIVSGEIGLYFIGNVTYKDIFDKKHATEYCLGAVLPQLDYSVDPGKPVPVLTGPCPSHNCMDKQCEAP